MKVIETAGPWGLAGGKICAAIGVFDGVHLGHQEILRRTMAEARSRSGLAVAVTFDCHPNLVVAPERAPALLYPLSKKLRALREQGLDAVRLIHFDKAFSQLPPGQFLRELAANAGDLATVCVGEGFTFGHKREGDTGLLRSLGAKLGFLTLVAPEVALDGRAVSSTRAREAVRRGDFALAGRLLGRPYGLCGVVRRGAQLGRSLGFPTANLDVTGLVMPPNGVYVAEAVFGTERKRAAVNIGFRPTVEIAAPAPTVEAHLLEFDGDLYGREVDLIFRRKLREERKFSSVEALRDQVARDVAEAAKL